jgi:2,3-bisphosphoglycerate-dependent phosphoglycerate mutase
MSGTSLTLIRHGETEWNVAMRLQGMKNSNLTEKGLDQARMAGQALMKRTYDVLISSDLERAVKTAEILNAYHHLPVEQNKLLRERNFGVMEGLTREQIMAKYPATYHEYMNRNDVGQIPEGESLVEFHGRVTGAMNSIVKEHTGKRILIVTHGGVLDCMMRMIFDYPLSAPRRFSIFNASINDFVFEDGHWYLETWGNIDFQQGEAVSIDEPKE